MVTGIGKIKIILGFTWLQETKRTLHCPTYSGGLLQTPQDSNSGLCQCDMGQLWNYSPDGVWRSLPDSADSAGLYQDSVRWSPTDSVRRSPTESGGVGQTLTGKL